MARGFESKSVQEQWQDAEARDELRKKKRIDPQVLEKSRRRDELLLSRNRIERELSETTSDRRRETLRAALDHLNGELNKVG